MTSARWRRASRCSARAMPTIIYDTNGSGLIAASVRALSILDVVFAVNRLQALTAQPSLLGRTARRSLTVSAQAMSTRVHFDSDKGCPCELSIRPLRRWEVPAGPPPLLTPPPLDASARPSLTSLLFLLRLHADAQRSWVALLEKGLDFEVGGWAGQGPQPPACVLRQCDAAAVHQLALHPSCPRPSPGATRGSGQQGQGETGIDCRWDWARRWDAKQVVKAGRCCCGGAAARCTFGD